MKGWFLLTLVSLVASRSWGLQIGDPVPDVSAPSTDGKTVKLSDLKGAWVVVYFFPKSFTPGCTAESCALRNGYEEIQKLGAVIFGVSMDDPNLQKKFKAEYHLPFELLSDSMKEVSKAFDSVGASGLVAARKTFIISPEGKIAYIFDKVNTGTHDQEVLAELKSLKAQKPAAGSP
jgi:thioredoxin-dependent peroxiredoxin